MRFMPFGWKILTLGFLAGLVACTAIGERTLVSVGYYTVKGDTFGELDQEIKLHGPNVTGVGSALASTDLRMLPNIQYERIPSGCHVDTARVNVKARVTLPRHANVSKLKQELAQAWSNLEEYARIHEAVHLAIADRYAVNMERAILALPAMENCRVMRAKAQNVFSKLFVQHHKDQLQFDADEKKRIKAISKRAESL